jgi:hypothetical protein
MSSPRRQPLERRVHLDAPVFGDAQEDDPVDDALDGEVQIALREVVAQSQVVGQGVAPPLDLLQEGGVHLGRDPFDLFLQSLPRLDFLSLGLPLRGQPLLFFLEVAISFSISFFSVAYLASSADRFLCIDSSFSLASGFIELPRS